MQMDQLEPKKVFYFFSELAKIPRGSGNTDAVAAYCMNFAKERDLTAYRDDYGNVMIFKNGTAGYEQSETVILQGHLDMVCEKRPDCTKDMEHEGIDLVIDGDYLRADGTTLGGDNGIAIAYMLALLDDNSGIAHPPIEALFTADEEIGLRGAFALDASRLKGKRMINLDSEKEGSLTVSCAGAVHMTCILPVRYEKSAAGMCAKRITIGGLLGGHSGDDIRKNRKNAAKALGEFLYELKRQLSFQVADFTSGGRLNVIPQSAEAILCMEQSQTMLFDKTLSDFNAELKAACAQTEPDAFIAAADAALPEEYLDGASVQTVVAALMLIPNGITAISTDIPFLVQSSSNLGSVSIEGGELRMGIMVRSNTEHGKSDIMRRIQCLMEGIGGFVSAYDEYPAWAYSHTSPLRDVMVSAYEAMYGEKPRICAIHAGLECGILSEKLGGADMVSMGPNMKGIHTPDEQLEIPSVERCWNYLLQVLENLR